jgi:hypothetical protein
MAADPARPARWGAGPGGGPARTRGGLDQGSRSPRARGGARPGAARRATFPPRGGKPGPGARWGSTRSWRSPAREEACSPRHGRARWTRPGQQIRPGPRGGRLDQEEARPGRAVGSTRAADPPGRAVGLDQEQLAEHVPPTRRGSPVRAHVGGDPDGRGRNAASTQTMPALRLRGNQGSTRPRRTRKAIPPRGREPARGRGRGCVRRPGPGTRWGSTKSSSPTRPRLAQRSTRPGRARRGSIRAAGAVGLDQAQAWAQAHDNPDGRTRKRQRVHGRGTSSGAHAVRPRNRRSPRPGVSDPLLAIGAAKTVRQNQRLRDRRQRVLCDLDAVMVVAVRGCDMHSPQRPR